MDFTEKQWGRGEVKWRPAQNVRLLLGCMIRNYNIEDSIKTNHAAKSIKRRLHSFVQIRRLKKYRNIQALMSGIMEGGIIHQQAMSPRLMMMITLWIYKINIWKNKNFSSRHTLSLRMMVKLSALRRLGVHYNSGSTKVLGFHFHVWLSFSVMRLRTSSCKHPSQTCSRQTMASGHGRLITATLTH